MRTWTLKSDARSNTRVLGIIRHFVTSLARQMGFEDEAVDQIELAVDEACANVVRHAYKHLGVSPDLAEEHRTDDERLARACTLRMRIHPGEERLRITVIDQGIGIQSDSKGVNSLEEF